MLERKVTKSLYSSALAVGAAGAESESWLTTEGTTDPRTFPDPWNGLTEAWKRI